MNTTTPASNKPVPGPPRKFLPGSLTDFMHDALDASNQGFLEYSDIVQYHLSPV